jgi:hypothetical protein
METPQPPKKAYLVRVHRAVSFEFDVAKGYDEAWVQLFVVGLVSSFKKDFEVPRLTLPPAQQRGERIGQFLKLHARRWGVERASLLEITVTFEGHRMPWTEFTHDRRSNKYRPQRAPAPQGEALSDGQETG